MAYPTRFRTVPILFFLVFLVHAGYGEQKYTIRAGDTLYSIARNFGVSAADIQKKNGIKDPSHIKTGQILVIPSDTREADASVTFNEYKVKKGDSLFAIARTWKISRSDIARHNGISPDAQLKAGQVLRIPVPSLAEATPPPVATPRPEEKPVNPPAEGNAPILDLKDYDTGKDIVWPAAGDRFASKGKWPGILIKAHSGDAIRLVSGGVVIYSNAHSIYGHVVFVESPNGYTYVYGGNSTSSLALHQSVKAGELVGEVAVSPGLNEPYVFFSTYNKAGRYVDPAKAPRG